MAKVRIVKAGPPLAGKWVVAWRTPRMSVSAYWYCDTKAQAAEAARRLRGEAKAR